MNEPSSDSTRVRHISPAEPVPLFNCVVYLRQSAEGVVARVGNLSGLEVTAENERQALQQIVPQFKTTIQDYVAREEEIPWNDSPQPEDGEQERLIAVHL